MTISHLFDADDTLFLCEWNEENIKNLSRILTHFHVSSELKVNVKKSRVFGIGVEPEEVERWVAPLGCKPDNLPFTYIGVPVGVNMNLKKHWKLVLDRFHSKLIMESA